MTLYNFMCFILVLCILIMILNLTSYFLGLRLKYLEKQLKKEKRSSPVKIVSITEYFKKWLDLGCVYEED